MNFFKELFFLNFKDYENIGVDFPIGIFMIALTVAIAALLFYMNGKKLCIHTMLKRSIRLNAIGEGEAKTLAELGLSDSRALKSALSGGGQLNYIVKRIDAEPTDDASAAKAGVRIDFKTSKFYILEDRLDRAKRMLETESDSWWQPIILSALLLALLILFGIFADEILSALSAYLAPSN